MGSPESGSVLCLGDLFLDIVLGVARDSTGSPSSRDISLHLGGSTANTAAWLVSQRTPTTLIASAGNDAAGELLMATLRRLGIYPEVQVGQETDGSSIGSGVFVAETTDGSYRTLAVRRGANDALDWHPHLEKLIDSAHHLHIGGYALGHSRPRQVAIRAARAAHERGIIVSLDMCAPHILTSLSQSELQDILRALAPDIAFANEDEAALLPPDQLGLDHSVSSPTTLSTSHLPIETAVDTADLLARLLTWTPIAILKRGANGSAAQGRQPALGPVHVPPPTIQIVDAVGAGDAFVAGFLAAWLAHRRQGPLTTSTLTFMLEQATAVAARCLAQSGGSPQTA